ncbi:transient receptor potential cation channel subfamily A member 1-like [Ptychodera flava]|uniref:transient receptor potential cation channel subfamily A member 1-like n=1 Tax=Ptychodera flava TaxID=63121 RepID=UPI003969C86D
MASIFRRKREIGPSSAPQLSEGSETGRKVRSSLDRTQTWTNLVSSMQAQQIAAQRWATKTRTLRSARANAQQSNTLQNLIFSVDSPVANCDPEDTDIDIWQAAKFGDISDCKRLLDEKPWLLDVRDSLGATALHYAVRFNHKDVVQELLNRNVGVNEKLPGYKMTALHLAARSNFTNIIRRLIKHGADVNARDDKGQVPLHLCTKEGHFEATKLFLYVGADVNARDKDHMTPLHYVASRGNASMCDLLLCYGADLTAKEINDITPVMFAAICGSMPTMKLLIDTGRSLNLSCEMFMADEDDEGSTTFLLAVARSHIEIAEYCLDIGADINAQKCNGFTALHTAAVIGYVDMTTMLVRRGAKLNVVDHERMTPLHRAAMYGSNVVADVLIKNGSTLEARDVEGFTPFLAAAWKGQTETAKYLIENNANVHARDRELKNCLHWAAEGNHTDFVEMILEKVYGGCTLIENKDKNEQTPSHVAVETGNIKILNLLIKGNASISIRDYNEQAPIHLAAKKGRFECIEALAVVDVRHINDDDGDGCTPLLLASQAGHLKVVNHLLKVGADIGSRDENRRTALALAAAGGHVDVVATLLKNHADIDATDKNRNTALHLSAANGHDEVTSYLIDEGANPLMKNSKGENCLDIATENQEDVTATVIINSKKWQDIISQHDDKGFTSFNRLIEKLPNVAYTVLDKCVRYTRKDKQDPDLKVTYNFRHVDPGPDSVTAITLGKKWTALKTMVSWKRQNLLTHELCRTLLDLKWKTFGRAMFLFDVFIYLAYLLTLTYLCLGTDHIFNSPKDGKGCPLPAGLNLSIPHGLSVRFITVPGYDLNRLQLFALELFITVYLSVCVLREFYELLQSGYRYFMEISNWVDWGLYISALYFILPPGKRPCTGQWASGAIALFLSWLNLILYFRRTSLFGLYVVMFFKVLKSFLKVGLVYLLFAVGFAFSFYMLLATLDAYSSLGKSLITTLVMTIGELSYADAFYNENPELNKWEEISLVMYIVFIFVMPIVLMNLMLGVAVGDIDEVRKTATIEKLEMEINLLNHMERSLPKFIQRKLYVPNLTVEPNAIRCCSKVKDRVSTAIRELEGTGKSEKSETEEAEALIGNIEEFRSSVQKRQRLLTRMLDLHSSLLQKMAEKLNVKFDEAEFRAIKDLSNIN